MLTLKCQGVPGGTCVRMPCSIKVADTFEGSFDFAFSCASRTERFAQDDGYFV